MILEKPTPSTEQDIALTEDAVEMRKRSLILPEGAFRFALPELPETVADEVYEHMLETEMRLASADMSLKGYIDGSALTDDEMLVLQGAGGMLASAEHGTAQLRDGRHKNPDTGTAALVTVLHERLGSSGIIMKGRQTGDANFDATHPLKDYAGHEILREQYDRFVSIHGMVGGKFTPALSGLAERPYDVLLGIGDDPGEETAALAKTIQSSLHAMGFLVGINTPFLKVDEHTLSPFRRQQADGTEAYTYLNFKAGGKTTRAHVEKELKAAEQSKAAIQVELSDLLRIRDTDREVRRNKDGTLDVKRIALGVYAGFEVMKLINDSRLQ